MSLESSADYSWHAQGALPANSAKNLTTPGGINHPKLGFFCPHPHQCEKNPNLKKKKIKEKVASFVNVRRTKLAAFAFFKTCISTNFPEAIHTQQHVEVAHLPLPYSKQHEAGLKQCSLVKTIKSNWLEHSSQTSSSTD